jgi:hypothetical protein
MRIKLGAGAILPHSGVKFPANRIAQPPNPTRAQIYSRQGWKLRPAEPVPQYIPD